MTPAQRIAAVLHSRGREVNDWEVEAWLEGHHRKCAEFGKIPVSDCDFATAIERGAKMPTMFLHLRFGDALD